MLASVGDDNRVRLWDFPAGKELWQKSSSGNAIAFSPDGRFLAVGACLHDAATGRELWRTGGGEKLAFSSDGRILAVASPQSQVILLDTATGKRLPIGIRGTEESGTKPLPLLPAATC